MVRKDIFYSGEERRVRWTARTLETLRVFPEAVRWVMGRALYKAQLGKRHEAAAPLKGMLAGVVEIKAEVEGNAYRLYYTLKCPGTVDVLHAHQKKSKRGGKLPQTDRDLIHHRYRAVLKGSTQPRDR